jgi:hemoglobin-like flavoprotein
MSGLTDSKRRDFIAQFVVILEQNTQLFTAKGYDPTAKIAELKDQMAQSDQAEGQQREAMAKAKDATQKAYDKLTKAYTNASATVDLVSGLLGKKDNLLIEIKKLRKITGSPKTPPPAE